MSDSSDKKDGEDERQHPGKQPWEPEDPMSLKGAAGDGDPMIMLRCVVEEYARMGMAVSDIERMFATPFFRAAHDLTARLGPEVVQQEINAIVKRCGVHRFKTVHATNTSPGCNSSDGTASPCSPAGHTDREA